MTTDRLSFAVLAVLVAASALASGCGSAGSVERNAYTRGVDLYADGDLQGAQAAFKEALVANPADVRASYNLALVYHDLYLSAKRASLPTADEYSKLAADEYANTLRIDPGNARAISGLAVLRRDQGDPQGAVLVVQAEPKDEEGKSIALWTRGVLLRDAGDAAGAETAFRGALDHDPFHLPATTALARLLFDAGRRGDAETVVAKGIEVHAFDLPLRLLHAEAALGAAREAAPGSEEAGRAWIVVDQRLDAAGALVERHWRIAWMRAEAAEASGDVGRAVRSLWNARDWASDLALEKAGLDAAKYRADISARLTKLYARLPEWEASRGAR